MQHAERGQGLATAVEAGEVVYRDLGTHEEYVQCVALQRAVWGPDFADPVPAPLLKVSQKVGGLLIGAFDGADRLLGFVFGLTGVKGGRPGHWSHMLAVVPEARGLGVGQRLKALQRERLLERGIDRAYWTYDPLVARNAHVNLNRLGAEASEYVPDMYGPLPAAGLGPAFGTDRFIVEWRLASERVARTLAGEEVAAADEAAWENGVVVNAVLGAADEPLPVEGALPAESAVRVEIPADIEALRAVAPALAAAWRASTRRALLRYLGEGYCVAGFRRDPSTGRCHYLLCADSSR
ncbi:MAG: GNAT family N-acetyltransferase [Gemmatimonadetes bacterium]|nr:GNAT family N-acetyltransferase [Gemmatimonadota bacterium]